jgi:hypothetical protein
MATGPSMSPQRSAKRGRGAVDLNKAALRAAIVGPSGHREVAAPLLPWRPA